jgi:hypothetical protein
VELPYCDVTTEFYSEKRHRASGRSKGLKCCECNAPIDKGEIYYRCAGKWDGYLWSGAQHLYCWLFARSLNNHDSIGWHRYNEKYPFQLTSGVGLNAWGINDGYGGCVQFEGIYSFLTEYLPHDESEFDADFYKLTHNPLRFWKAMQSGCKEVFSLGSGI